MIRLRHADELVGLLVLAAVVAFLGAILQAGVLRDWFRPVSQLRIVLPEAGAAGLSVGADVEVLGTHAGVVRRVVISPNQQMYAEAEIDDQARAFIRRDSKGTIRRRYGVAGAAYVDVSRGTGAELDWNYAVIQAVTERDPTESIGALIDQARQKIFPILDDAGRSTKALADVMERMQKGEGDVGRLLTDETMVRDIEAIVAKTSGIVSDLGQLVSELQLVGSNVKDLSQSINARDGGVPGLLRRADATLATLQQSMRDLAVAIQRAPQIVHSVELGARDLPGLLTQTQETAHELEQLAIQLRGLWLLGGGGSAPDTVATSTDEMLQRETHAGQLAFELERNEEAAAQYRTALNRAQARDDADAIGDTGYDLAVAELRANAPDKALADARATRIELERRGAKPFPALLLAEATALYRTGAAAEADRAAQRIQQSEDPDAVARATFLRGVIADDRGDEAGLATAADALTSAKTPPFQADSAELTSRLALRRGDGARAREEAARAADLRQASLDYRGLARALAIEGAAAERAGDKVAAADLFLRAGRSAAAQGDKSSASVWFSRAMSLAPGRPVGRDAADLLRGIDKDDH